MMRTPQPLWARSVGVIGLAVIFTAALWLLWSGNLEIRYTADHERTMPVWHQWIPALVCILLIRLFPWPPAAYTPPSRFAAAYLGNPSLDPDSVRGIIHCRRDSGQQSK